MEILGGLGGFAALIFAAIALLAPIWLYMGQKYAWQCRQELREIKKMIQPLANDLNLKMQIASAEEKVEQQKRTVKPMPEDPARPNVAKAQCGSCDKTLTYPKTSSGKRVKCPDCNQAFTLP